MSSTVLAKIKTRLDKLEEQGLQNVMLLLETISSATFFGEIKKTNCEFAKGDQCSFYFLKKEAKAKLPIATDCRIRQCKESTSHCHIELSNLTCALCPICANFEGLDLKILTDNSGEKVIQEE